MPGTGSLPETALPCLQHVSWPKTKDWETTNGMRTEWSPIRYVIIGVITWDCPWFVIGWSLPGCNRMWAARRTKHVITLGTRAWSSGMPFLRQSSNRTIWKPDRNRAKYTVSKLVHQQIANAALLHPKFFVSFPRIQFSETIKLRIRGFFHERKNSGRTCHHEVKCRKALWL